MYWLLAAAVFLIVFIFSCIKGKRRFYNAVLLFVIIVLTFIGLSIISYNNGWEILYSLMICLLYGIAPLSVLGLVFLLIVDTFVLLKRERISIKNLLPFAFACFLVASCVFLIIAVMGDTDAFLVNISVFCAGVSLYCGIVFMCFLIYSWLYSFMPKDKNADYIIVHGSGLIGGNKIPPLLASRIDKGIELYKRTNGKAMLIASGGKGSDEDLSEAQAMHDYMVEKGVPDSSIIIENKSVNTQQNIEMSKEIIEKRQNGESYSCLFVTSNYHVLRTSLLARKAGLKGEGVGAKTRMYYWITAFLREYVAIMVKYKIIMIVFVVALIIAIVLSNLNI